MRYFDLDDATMKVIATSNCTWVKKTRDDLKTPCWCLTATDWVDDFDEGDDTNDDGSRVWGLVHIDDGLHEVF